MNKEMEEWARQHKCFSCNVEAFDLPDLVCKIIKEGHKENECPYFSETILNSAANVPKGELCTIANNICANCPCGSNDPNDKCFYPAITNFALMPLWLRWDLEDLTDMFEHRLPRHAKHRAMWEKERWNKTE